jgi:ribulose-5-phosphate 4-epimerase/fuculose-1-phosphate aldolase
MIIKNTEEGYIKFVCNFEQESIDIPQEIFDSLNKWRNVLWEKGWIGTYPDGIGFGNISVRLPKTNQFYITGSATGEFSTLQTKHYSLVEDCNIEKNMIWCRGLTKASSESMSHYVIYRTLPEVNAVVHIHHLRLWEKYSAVLPTTANNVEYGTPEMAYEIERILKDIETNVIIMGGHREGIISFADTLEKATGAMLRLER